MCLKFNVCRRPGICYSLIPRFPAEQNTTFFYLCINRPITYRLSLEKKHTSIEPLLLACISLCVNYGKVLFNQVYYIHLAIYSSLSQNFVAFGSFRLKLQMITGVHDVLTSHELYTILTFACFRS